MSDKNKPRNNTAAAARVADAAKGLGALVWWTLSATAITPPALRAILADEGLAIKVPDIDQGAAVRRAAREWSTGRGADRYKAEVADETASHVTIGILRRESPKPGEVAWRQVDVAVFEVATGTWASVPSSDQGIAFCKDANVTRTHLDHQFIRPHIVQAQLAQLDAANLRERGGVCYVPVQQLAGLATLQRVVERIGGSKLEVLHIQATADSAGTIARAASASVAEDVGSLVDRIKGWSDSARKVSDASAQSVFAELAQLKQKADLYSDALSMSLDDIATAIDEARREAERVIGICSSGSATPSGDRKADASKADQSIVNALRALVDKYGCTTTTREDGTKSYSLTVTGEKFVANGWTEGRHHSRGFWKPGGKGADAAAALGFVSVLRKQSTESDTAVASEVGNDFITSFSLVSIGGEAPATGTPSVDDQLAGNETAKKNAASWGDALPKPGEVIEEDEDGNVILDVDAEAAKVRDEDEDATADLREKLAALTPKDVFAKWTAATGKKGKIAKNKMIDDLVKLAA